ncbi:MAG TPA: hypothetical protein VMT72_12215 [Pseudolabrys sp.]|nr:hypothetical protein [Pseudolabrys sp.]
MSRTPQQVIHDSLQEWNTDEFVELDWNNKAAAAVIKALNNAGYIVAPASMFSVERAPQSHSSALRESK